MRDKNGAISLCQIGMGPLDLVKEIQLHPKDDKGTLKVLNNTVV